MNLRIIVEYPRTWALIPSSPSWNQVLKFTLRNQASRCLALLHRRGRQISVVAEFLLHDSSQRQAPQPHDLLVAASSIIIHLRITLSRSDPSLWSSEIVAANPLYRNLKARSAMVKFILFARLVLSILSYHQFDPKLSKYTEFSSNLASKFQIQTPTHHFMKLDL